MALTGEIRKRSGLIITLIGVALFAFLVSDSFQSGSALFGGNKRSVGEVNGTTVSYEEFATRMAKKEQLYENANFNIDNRDALVDEVWEEVKFDYFTKEQYEQAGISVTGDELINLANSDNPPQIMRQIFTNNGQGQYDKNLALNYFKAVQEGQIEGNELYAWKIRENLMVKVREIEKYSRYIVNGMYATNLQTKKDYTDKNVQLNAKVVGLDYTKVNADSMTVTDAELSAYLSKHKDDFKLEEKASIEYVLINVVPSSKDTNAALDYVAGQIEAFKKAEDDSVFLRAISTVPYNKNFRPRGSFEPTQEEKIFAADSGQVLGPFYNAGSYELLKVTGFKKDTVSRVRASHILIKADGPTDADTAAAMGKALDYMKKIKSGEETFEEMAQLYGTDGTASKGGDLGWFGKGQMVKPFEDAVFSHKKGDIFITKTQFGVHIIKITENPDNTLVRVARLRTPIDFSGDTKDSLYDIADAVAIGLQKNENSEEVANSNGLQLRLADEIKPGQKSLPGLSEAGELMRWIFDDETKVGSSSDVMQIDDKYLVAKVVKHTQEGDATVDDVRDELTARVKKEKQAEILTAQIEEALKSNPNPEGLAVTLKTVVREIRAQEYSGATLQYFNNDYAVFGTLFGLPLNQVSKPIVGDQGVYVAWVTDVKQPEVPEDLSKEKQMLNRQITGAAAGAIEAALTAGADIKDKRYKFY